MKMSFKELRSAKVSMSLADLASHKAISIKELLHQTPGRSLVAPDGHDKVKNCTVAFRGLNKKANKWHITYHVRCNEEYSRGTGHIVRMRFYPTPGMDDIFDLNVEVSCECDAFVYWGAQWELHGRNALERTRPLLQAPDPSIHLTPNDQRDYVICKHVAAAAEYASKLLKRHLDRYTT